MVTEFVLGLAVVCSNAINTPTQCKARIHPFPSEIACALANDNIVASVNEENKVLPPGAKLKIALLECRVTERPDLNEGL